MPKNKKGNNSQRLLLLASFTNNLGWGIYSPLYAIFVLKLGGSSFDVSLVMAVYAFVAGLLMIIFGRLENHRRYNPSFMLVIGYGLFIVVAVGYTLIHTVEQFYVMQMVLAVAMGILMPAAQAAYARSQKRGKEAGAWGLYQGGNYILIAAAAFIGGIIYKFAGFDGLFVTMLVIQILATLLAIRNYLYSKNH